MFTFFLYFACFLVYDCVAAELNCSRPSVIRRYTFGTRGLVDTTGTANATQVNDAAPVLFDGVGAHFTNDSYGNPDGGSDGAGLHLGDLEAVVGGRTIHVELTPGPMPLPSGTQYLYWYFDGTLNDPLSLEYIRAYAFIGPYSNGTTQVAMQETRTAGSFNFFRAVIPNEQLRWRTLLSFSLDVRKVAEPDKYDVRMAIYLNGTRVATEDRLDDVYEPRAGFMSLGRWLPCNPEGSCGPFFGTMHSVTIDTVPLDHTVDVYDEWESCSTPAGDTTGEEGTTTASSSATMSSALVFTGRDLDGGGAVGLDEEESAGTQGSGLPLTLIIVLAALAVVCLLALGALFVWRSRRRQRTVALMKNGKSSSLPPTGDAPASSGESSTLPRVRSSKRRRGGTGNYAAIVVPADTGRTSADYVILATPSSDTADYTMLPAVDGSDTVEGGEEGPSQRSHAYGQVGTPSAAGTYTELTRAKADSPHDASYATGELELTEV
jgi:hypothetical protein